MTMPERIPPEVPGRGDPDLPPGALPPGRGWPGPRPPGAVPPDPSWRPGGMGPTQLYEQLLERGIVMIYGLVDTELATSVCAQLMSLEAAGTELVQLHLRSPDADLEAAFAVIDTMDGLDVPVRATATGEVGGCALGIFAAAPRRQVSPSASLRLSEPRLRFEGTAADVAALEQQHRRLVDAFFFRLAEVTGREVDEIRDDARAVRYLSAAEAAEYGLTTDP